MHFKNIKMWIVAFENRKILSPERVVHAIKGIDRKIKRQSRTSSQK